MMSDKGVVAREKSRYGTKGYTVKEVSQNPNRDRLFEHRDGTLFQTSDPTTKLGKEWRELSLPDLVGELGRYSRGE